MAFWSIRVHSHKTLSCIWNRRSAVEWNITQRSQDMLFTAELSLNLIQCLTQRNKQQDTWHKDQIHPSDACINYWNIQYCKNMPYMDTHLLFSFQITKVWLQLWSWWPLVGVVTSGWKPWTMGICCIRNWHCTTDKTSISFCLKK